MNAKTDKPVHLSDYQKPNYLIGEAQFRFDVFETKTRVVSHLAVRRNRGVSGDALSLNGEGLKLIEVSVNGKPLSAHDYELTASHLILPNPPAEFSLEIENEIEPHRNKSLEGLYRSGDMFCTQNEPEGFRHITYFLDRPDVMTKMTTTISADRKKYPVLLCNGNLIDSGDAEDGRHFVTWQDPFPKPAYLFALVAGCLGVVTDRYKTRSGRTIQLKLYVDKGNEPKTTYAMGALKRAMKWDEDTFGLECDLDTYMIVAVDAFNMGAMENKGLNIFNSQYILADPKTATDQNYLGIESVIGHEYFHNWTGNRVTCRDWFQITLKEGLTIFRDQEFSSDMSSRSVKRISDVRVLRDHQFVEDAGPNAHPVRPSTYLEINNFYTSTVYQKGSEVIRMIHTLIGRDLFRKGMEIYFKRFDGQAVTTDDFVSAMEQASGMDLTQFKLWYEQRGTPVCHVVTRFDRDRRELECEIKQTPSAVAPPEERSPFYFPLSVGFLDEKGKDLPLELKGERSGKKGTTRILHVSEAEQSFVFKNIPYHPVPSLLRNFSAPVELVYEYTTEELMFLLTHDSDPFNRYEAARRLAALVLGELIEAHLKQEKLFAAKDLLDAFGSLLSDERLDPAFKAEVLVLPSETQLVETMNPCDFEAAHAAREFLIQAIAQAHEEEFLSVYRTLSAPGIYSLEPKAIGRRTLKNLALRYVTAIQGAEHWKLAEHQFESASNMTDELSALSVLCDLEVEARDRAIRAFYGKWKHDSLVMNKWFAVQAASKHLRVFEHVKALARDPAYDGKNPNKIRSLVGVFGQNLVRFHDVSGECYAWMADQVMAIDEFNPIVASRMTHAFQKFQKLGPRHKALMAKSLDRILGLNRLSRDVFEVISKIRG